VRHHLVDEHDPGDDFTLARFVERAERVIAQLHERNVQPIVVGGTGMYLRGLLRGIIPAPEVDPRLRRRLREMRERRDDRSMHRWLARVDPASAARISPHDRQRVDRALEWWLASRSRWSERLERQGTWTGKAERFRCLKLGLDADTGWLRTRLEARVDRFFAAGLVEEVRGLLASGVPAECNAFKAIGYREVARALRAGGSVEEAVELVKIRTAQYVKRQRTWFRKEPGIVWLNAADSSATLRRTALDVWARFREERV
jgi:tRNA dimethylallyltransferase